MIIDVPTSVPALRLLWKQAFGDPDDFLDCFFNTAFSLNRCRCVYKKDTLAAMLYWFDCVWQGKRLAYLYAVATDRAFQGQGFCRALIENTHRHLKELGYHGSILVPRTPELFRLYEKLSYRTCCTVREFSCPPSGEAVPLRQINVGEYAALRRQMLPDNSVVQEQETLALLETYAAFYKGENILLAAYPENGTLTICELLGDTNAAPDILYTLGYTDGKIRTPGKEKPFAMYHPLTDDLATPSYFGLALD